MSMTTDKFATDCSNFEHTQIVYNWCFISSFAALVYMYFFALKQKSA